MMMPASWRSPGGHRSSTPAKQVTSTPHPAMAPGRKVRCDWDGSSSNWADFANLFLVALDFVHGLDQKIGHLLLDFGSGHIDALGIEIALYLFEYLIAPLCQFGLADVLEVVRQCLPCDPKL